MSAAAAPLLAVGWSLHLPGVPIGATIAEHVGRPRGSWAWEDCAPPDRAATVLGRKGLLFKEPATRLALCAVHRALGLPMGSRPEHPTSARTAVIACSNLGNVETVARVTRTVAAQGGHAVSVMDAPNVSSNVIASTVALWFGFGGPNLMLCSGAKAGFDGLSLAGLLLRARRAERVVLVGVEPADEVATALHGTAPHSTAPHSTAPHGTAPPLRAGAACMLLQAWRPELPAIPGQALVELVPEHRPWPRAPQVMVGPGGFDPARHWGDLFGAQGVAALALAAHLAADEGHRVVGVRDSGDDRVRMALVTTVGVPR